MRLYQNIVPAGFMVLTTFLTFYSWAFVDPNFTLFSSPVWTIFRNLAIQVGYFQRELSTQIYLVVITLLFVVHLLANARFQVVNLRFIVVLAGICGVLSYPFLSHDLFNYMFDAKIVTHYFQNPYLNNPHSFSPDPWLRFMHWTHRTYPYGPVFLLITLVPSFLSFGKLFASFFLFKTVSVFFFGISVYVLNKIDKRLAVFFATSPIVILEGLVSAHNEMYAVTLALAGVYLLVKKRRFSSRLLLLASGGVKYMTLPVVLLQRLYARKISFARLEPEILNIVGLVGTIGLIVYIALTGEIQPWYFLNLFIFLPYFPRFLFWLSPLFLGLLYSYYPYIRYGEWGTTPGQVTLKHTIIVAALAGTLAIFLLCRATYLRKILHLPFLDKEEDV